MSIFLPHFISLQPKTYGFFCKNRHVFVANVRRFAKTMASQAHAGNVRPSESIEKMFRDYITKPGNDRK